VAIAVATEEQWTSLRGLLGEPAWASTLTSTAARRGVHDLIDEHLGAWCAARSAEAAVDVLLGAGIPAAIVVHPSAQLGFEQLHARRFFEQVDHPVCGPSTHVTFPFRLPGQDGVVHRRAAPLLGEHDDEILGGLLGLTAAELAALRARGVIGTELI